MANEIDMPAELRNLQLMLGALANGLQNVAKIIRANKHNPDNRAAIIAWLRASESELEQLQDAANEVAQAIAELSGDEVAS